MPVTPFRKTHEYGLPSVWIVSLIRSIGVVNGTFLASGPQCTPSTSSYFVHTIADELRSGTCCNKQYGVDKGRLILLAVHSHNGNIDSSRSSIVLAILSK